MDCAFPVELIRSLLRLSDRQPVGALDGLDLAAFAPAFVDRLLETGVLVERTPLREADGLVVQVVGREPVAFSVDGHDLTECVHPEALRRYEIDVLVLCKALRSATPVLSMVRRSKACRIACSTWATTQPAGDGARFTSRAFCARRMRSIPLSPYAADRGRARSSC